VTETCNCPHCNETCDRAEVDVGVGVIHGPWGCPQCGWSSEQTYDNRDGVKRDGDDRVFDQYGVSHSINRVEGMLVLDRQNVDKP
jgi:ssDNA-binding Zn-finger/Zn-ribbon topoisomerase 1